MFGGSEENAYLCTRKTEKVMSQSYNMVPVVQLVRASDCGSECRRFESVRAPQKVKSCNPRDYGTFAFPERQILMEH